MGLARRGFLVILFSSFFENFESSYCGFLGVKLTKSNKQESQRKFINSMHSFL
jgi:hypothetical protein